MEKQQKDPLHGTKINGKTRGSLDLIPRNYEN
jgi:hypothetical protein